MPRLNPDHQKQPIGMHLGHTRASPHWQHISYDRDFNLIQLIGAT